MCANFVAKQTTLNFSTRICPVMALGLEIQKSNVTINIVEIPYVCANFQAKQTFFTFSDQICLKMDFGSILGSKN